MGDRQLPPEAPEIPATDDSPKFRFLGFAVDQVLFEHLERVDSAGETQPINIGYKLNIQLGAAVPDPSALKAEVSLRVEVLPDPKWRPYRIVVKVVGKFGGESASPEVFKQFWQRSAPPILFPYVREVVHRLTADGRHGSVRIEPILIGELIQWGEIGNSNKSTP